MSMWTDFLLHVGKKGEEMETLKFASLQEPAEKAQRPLKIFFEKKILL